MLRIRRDNGKTPSGMRGGVEKDRLDIIFFQSGCKQAALFSLPAFTHKTSGPSQSAHTDCHIAGGSARHNLRHGCGSGEGFLHEGMINEDHAALGKAGRSDESVGFVDERIDQGVPDADHFFSAIQMRSDGIHKRVVSVITIYQIKDL